MQISALEVTKLLKTEDRAKDESGFHFAEIRPDDLPETRQPDKAEVARVVEMIAQAPDTREEIVMELKERIEKGEYKVSGEEIAEMMVRRMKADQIR
ncbi:MAG: flagellar biosynthesis anti-sigma factor FlgM [Armatimonadota bacterium]